MDITKIDLLHGATPLVELRRLADRLQSRARIFLKCDHVSFLGGGGNKLRKLEYLAAEALDMGADTLVTAGGLQSNHARLTAAVAAHCGMECELVLSKMVPRTTTDYEHNGNVLLMQHLGARLHVLDAKADLKRYIRERMIDLRAAGRKPYYIPFGGSSVLGALGYAGCAQEITSQLAAMKLKADMVFCACGSGGTQAGLLAGFAASGAKTEVKGISVLHMRPKIKPLVTSIANGALMVLGQPPLDNAATQVMIDDRFIGQGYGIPTNSGMAAIRLLAETEGILLDPVYTGKAFAGFLDATRQSRFTSSNVVVFVHTGGAPGLFAYADTLSQQFANDEMSADSLNPSTVAPPSIAVAAATRGPATVIQPENDAVTATAHSMSETGADWR
ncbi:MAG: D-cysteine desulfhydrase family protein [Brachymonas sp.]|nr:D-cysteine desulfhydrase family protein [Brachymonas sp.]